MARAAESHPFGHFVAAEWWLPEKKLLRRHDAPCQHVGMRRDADRLTKGAPEVPRADARQLGKLT
jgi:hypothetical protein